MSNRSVVITGLGFITPLSARVSTFWDNIVNGRSRFRPVTGLDNAILDRLPCTVVSQIPQDVFDDFHYVRSKYGTRPRFMQLALIAAREAYEQAGLLHDKMRPDTRTGVSVGVGMSSLQILTNSIRAIDQDRGRRLSPYTVPDLLVNMASAIVSMDLKLQGPSLSPSSACASGAHAIAEAERLIRMGSVDRMIAGGSESCMHELALFGFSQCRALSTITDADRASCPWSAHRSGFVMAEGAAMVVLEAEEIARERGAVILGRIAGSGMSSDAWHMTSPSPGGTGPQLAMRSALRDAGLAPDQITYVHAHAASTVSGDLAESQAIRAVFGDDVDLSSVPVVSSKGQTGHMLGAAGAIQLVVSILSMNRSVIPPNANLHDLDSVFDGMCLPRTPIPNKHITAVLLNSFGFGGTNVSLILTTA